MDCSSVELDCDGEYCTLLKDKIVTARKEHNCYECKSTILPKEQYRYQVTLYEGKIENIKTCLACVSLSKELFNGSHMFGSMLDDLSTHIDEIDGDISESCLVSLHPKARARVCDMLDRYNEEQEEDDAED